VIRKRARGERQPILVLGAADDDDERIVQERHGFGLDDMSPA
jgi:hypothetical protein